MLKKWIIATAALCLLHTPVSAHENIECANAKSTAAQLQCLKKTYEKQKENLNQSFADSLKNLDPDGQAAMKKAQTAWIAYRDLECPLKAQSVDNASLERLEELQCLSKLTQERLQALSEIEGEKPVSDMGVLPRWMNVLGSENPKVHWNYAARIEADFDCDSEYEYAMTGIEDTAGGFKAVVALAETVTSGKPKTTLFRFPLRNTDVETELDPHAICQLGVTLAVAQDEPEISKSSESKEEETKSEATCTTFIRVADSQCYEAQIRVQETGFVRGDNRLASPEKLEADAQKPQGTTPQPPPIPGKKK